jgi:hypothetical protein
MILKLIFRLIAVDSVFYFKFSNLFVVLYLRYKRNFNDIWF